MLNALQALTLTTLTLLSVSTMCPAASSASADQPRVTNVMPAFWAFQQEAATLETRQEILRRFRALVIDPHLWIYSKEQFARHITDEGVIAYLNTVEPDLETMRLLSAKIEQQSRTASVRFAQAFPRFTGDVTTAYLPSFYVFDGQTTLIDGEHALLFGVDGIAKFHGEDADLGVLFTHELFHIHHARTNPALFADEHHTPLYVGVWIEGLATYVSEELNPEASALQIMLDDQALHERGTPMAGQIAGMILSRFDSMEPTDQARFLTYGDKGDIPGRSGYLVGYLAAKSLGERLDLQELTLLQGEKLHALLREELSKLAGATHNSQ